MITALTFLFSPAGRVAGFAACALAFYGAGYWRGAATGSAACETASLRAEIAALKADIRIADDAARRMAVEADRLASEAAAHKSSIEEIRNAPRPACALSDGDARRLRAIGAGASPAIPAGP